MLRSLSALTAVLLVTPAVAVPAFAPLAADTAPTLVGSAAGSDQSAEVERCVERAKARGGRLIERGLPSGISDAVVRCFSDVYDPDPPGRKKRR